MRPPVDFYFDFSSPYSYIANEWIDALAARHGRTVRRHAILLGVTFQAAELKSPVAHPIKREYSLRDFARSARYEGVPFAMPEPFPIPTQNAARVYWWLHDGRGRGEGTERAMGTGAAEAGATAPDADEAAARGGGAAAAAQWTRSAFRAYFVRGVPLNDPVALRALAAESGLDAAAAEAAWNDPVWKQRLKRANEQAIAAGVFGAPFFIVDGEPFWGNDRKPQIERVLASGPF